MHYKATEDRSTKMHRHAEVHTKDDAKRNSDSKDEVQVPDKHDAYRDQMLDMLTELESIWDGHLGRVKKVKHRIHLTSTDERPIHTEQDQPPES